MKSITTYLNFDGNAREAMTFYAACLGAELSLRSFRDAQLDMPPGAEDRILHALLTRGPLTLMASDTMPGMPFVQGSNFSVCVDCDDPAEADALFASLGAGGRVTMPLQDTFWNARFGMITDRFGVSWMVNHQLPAKD